jgi:antitoxin PrlF
MVNPVLVSESTLTDRYQTTVPDTVRKALQLNKREKIRYTIQPNGDVLMSRADLPDEDPVLGQFLSFIAQDMAKNPLHIQAISSELVEHVQSIVTNVDIDLDSPLSDEDE